MPQIIGDELLARDGAGKLRSRIATVFPRAGIIVTLPGIHATQRIAYIDWLNGQRAAAGQPPMNDEEEERQLMSAVDLVLEDQTVLIRPDPDAMELAFEADELLQQIAAKRSIRFLHVLDSHVREAIGRRGERWRISPLPRSPREMRQMIESSRIGIGGREIYYYNKATGTRILTLHEMARLVELPDEALRGHLAEICGYCSQCNRLGSREIDFFTCDDPELHEAFGSVGLAAASGDNPRAACQKLIDRFRRAVAPIFQRDDLECAEWRSRMFAALLGRTDQEVSEEALLGLSAEFFMQVEWLPGARIDDGELILDPIFDDEDADATGDPSHRLSDERVRGFIFNFIREYGDIEYLNIGRVIGSLSSRQDRSRPRTAYLAEIKRRSDPAPILRIVRIQKWGVREHLDAGKDLLSAVMLSEEYTEYILDRRLGCQQLGMHLAPRVTTRKVGERYRGSNVAARDAWIRTPYFERTYIAGMASDKIAAARFADDQFAMAFARLLGRAAAPNVITGRTSTAGAVIFDRGDEVVVMNQQGMPDHIVVADHTGTFGDYRDPLSRQIIAYAAPVLARLDWVNDRRRFAEHYIEGFAERFEHIRFEYRKRRRAFDCLFKHLNRDENGSFAYRWECILQRLLATDLPKLTQELREACSVSISHSRGRTASIETQAGWTQIQHSNRSAE